MLSKHVKFVVLALTKVAAVLFPIAGIVDAIVGAALEAYKKDD